MRRSLKKIAILGSTGSIGRQCLNVVESLGGERLQVVALAAGKSIEQLAEQTARHRPGLVAVADAAGASELRERLRAAKVEPLPEIQHGAAGLRAVGTHPDAEMVVSAAVGVVGLEATYEAIRSGKSVALSNKEVQIGRASCRERV